MNLWVLEDGTWHRCNRVTTWSMDTRGVLKPINGSKLCGDWSGAITEVGEFPTPVPGCSWCQACVWLEGRPRRKEAK